MHVTKRIDLALLDRELTTAGVPHGALSHSGTDADGELLMLPASGLPPPVDLPAAAQPVVDAHDPPPPAYQLAQTLAVDLVKRTTNDTPTEVWRLTSATKHEYAGTFVFMATDAATFAVKRTDMVYVWKRNTAAPTLVGEAPISNVDEQGSASWNVAAAVVGNDLVVRVIGGRTATVDWLVRGRVETFGPGGLA